MHRELDNLRVRALMIQATAALGLGDPEEAIRCAERILKLDPYRERAVQVLMRTWAATGDRVRALAAYNQFRRHLDSELAAAPSLETQQLSRTLGLVSQAP
jgi:DNA-binding SARP family transcriptional activator